MCRYPKINYIGNKEKIANWIVENLPIKKGTVLDLFSGGAAVSYMLKKSGFTVISNDVLYSNYCISKALIENQNNTLTLNINEYNIYSFYSDIIYNKIKWMSNRLYFDHEVKELSCLVNYSHSLLGYNKYIFLALLRRAMIRKLPYSRMNIKWEQITKLRDEDLSYKKYKRKRAYYNKSFLYHIKENLKDYNLAIFNNQKDNKVYQKDAFDMIENLPQKVDLIYIDPPYPSTMNNYKDFYDGFDIIFDKEIEYTDFTDRTKFTDNIKKIIEVAKSKTNYIAVSLNNNSKPSHNEIIENIKDIVNNIWIYKREHIYQLTGKENKNVNYEILIVIKL